MAGIWSVSSNIWNVICRLSDLICAGIYAGLVFGLLAADAFYGITEIIYINNKSEAYR